MTTPISIWQAHNNFSSLSDVSVVIVSYVFVNGDVVDVQNCHDQVLLLKVSSQTSLEPRARLRCFSFRTVKKQVPATQAIDFFAVFARLRLETQNVNTENDFLNL